ncbi:MAG: pyridoxamine 5'-phosphate oxidase family protein [Pseudomonadota bacterium]
MIDADVKALVAAFPLGFTATVTPEGMPAVAPKGTFLVLDDATLGFAEIRSPGTMRNLRANPACEVNFIDILKRVGARVAGNARIIASGDAAFSELLPRWSAIWPDLAHRMRAFVLIDVAAVSTYRTPPYDDGATEDDMVATYKAKFAEMYQ